MTERSNAPQTPAQTLPRVMITGADGFVGHHLMASIEDHFPAGCQLLACGRTPCFENSENRTLDITDRPLVADFIKRWQPSHIVNLAAMSAVQSADSDPRAAWEVNLFGALNIAEAIQKHAPECFFLFVGSAEIYGDSFKSGKALDEHAEFQPVNVYASTKVAADLAFGQMARLGLRVARARPFNHTGPGQSEKFSIPAFAMQLARIEAGSQAPELYVGNLSAERDFLDVRDVVDAYCRILVRSNELPNGAAFNIASGRPRRIADILDELVAMANISVTIRQDPERHRPIDIPRVWGDAGNAQKWLDWQPQFPWDTTLRDILQHCRSAVQSENRPIGREIV